MDEDKSQGITNYFVLCFNQSRQQVRSGQDYSPVINIPVQQTLNIHLCLMLNDSALSAREPNIHLSGIY